VSAPVSTRLAPSLRWPLLAAGLLGAALLSPALAAAAGGAAIAVLLARRSPSWWLGLLIWGLAFHVLAIALLFGLARLPEQVVRGIAAWKEALVVLLVAIAAARMVFGRLRPTGVGATDLAIGALVGLTVLHAAAGPAGLARQLSPSGMVYAVRDLVFFVALYYVGRATPEIADDDRALRRLYAMGVVISVVGVVEWFVVTPDMLVLLGVASYVNDFLNVSAFTVGNEYGLPDNYWTVIGGRLVQRAGSLFLSSQGFASPFLVIMPAATLWVSLRRRWRHVPTVAGYGLLWMGLLLTITRMTIFACALEVVVLTLLARRPAALVSLSAVGTAAVAAIIAFVPGVAGYVWATLTWQTGSSESHSKDYANGLEALSRHPLGNGIGTTDQTAVRIGLDPLTADNLFLKYGVELGVPGLLLLLVVLTMFAWTGVRLALRGHSATHRAFGAFLAATTVGVAVNGATAVTFNGTMTAFLFFWFAGAATSVWRLDAMSDAGALPPSPTHG
jgi:hypothetical protein